MWIKRAEIFVSNRGLLEAFFIRDKPLNHFSYLVRSKLIKIFHLLQALPNPVGNVSIINGILGNKIKTKINFGDFRCEKTSDIFKIDANFDFVAQKSSYNRHTFHWVG